ncbi:hypothetical protein [Streptomyces sp. NPDC001068]|uniref:hypothetical protein n=1 Tax=Streptomyces sp. NPDC001068 TaxID=3364544 RepID=UPI0036C04D99
MTSQSAGTLRSRYAEQAASDLEENRQRQRELIEEISKLQQEESLLVDILTLAERYENPSDASRPAVQAQSRSAPRKQRRSPAAAHARGQVTGTSSEVKGKAHQPLLVDLLIELLGDHGEPCLARELREEFLQKHPDRAPTPQVVRNTLESLVAKGRVQRHRQRRSVMYTLSQPGESGISGA